MNTFQLSCHEVWGFAHHHFWRSVSQRKKAIWTRPPWRLIIHRVINIRVYFILMCFWWRDKSASSTVAVQKLLMCLKRREKARYSSALFMEASLLLTRTAQRRRCPRYFICSTDGCSSSHEDTACACRIHVRKWRCSDKRDFLYFFIIIRIVYTLLKCNWKCLSQITPLLSRSTRIFESTWRMFKCSQMQVCVNTT